jgi:DNA polymerase III alpha subunit
MDVDIDCTPSFNPTDLFKNWCRAAVVKDNKITPHPCGVYPQSMAVDPITKLAAIPYDEAEDLGYLKVDFLHLHVYSQFKTRAEIDMLIKKEPDWTLLQVPSVQAKLFQLAKHGDLLSELKPKSILELADMMALIRPGKKNFIGLYKKDKLSARKILYAKDDSGFSFKKSHAIAYSYVVLLQLHLIDMGKM